MHLLDADTLITGERDPYPLKSFPLVWQWLAHQGAANVIKIAREQYEEVTIGKGDLVDWLEEAPIKKVLLLANEPDPALVRRVVDQGYARGGTALDEVELVEVGQDPFLVARPDS